MKTLRRYQYNKVYSTRHAGTMVEAGSRSSPVTSPDTAEYFAGVLRPVRCLLGAWPQCKTTRLIFDQRSLISLGWAGWAGCDICSLSPDPHHSLSCRRLPRHERAASAAWMFVLMFSLSQLQHWPQCPRQILYQDIIYADIMFTQIHNFTEKSPILQSLSKLVVSAQNKGKYYC